MKKIIMIAALGSFLIFMFAAYQISIRTSINHEQSDLSKVKTAVQIKPMVNENTVIIYQYYYSNDKTIKQKSEKAPAYLQGLDMEQLQSVFKEWQIMLFSPEKVILRSRIDSISTETYVIGEKEGHLAVFYEDENKKICLKEQLDVPLSVFSENDRSDLKQGIVVEGEENLAKLLSDLLS